ncbi:MAG TPA: hypothetical protein PLO37_24920 [Candidatus Hydrogenedentes bacterium]|nr:hypothetical protein [Candidatus Hydrogenedentota bacterium]HPG70103.1 hypothetical protein [Candidatus Hydrogenedentota bacterium]
MMGEGNVQGSLLAENDLHPDHIGRDTFYGRPASEGLRVHPGEDFEDFYVFGQRILSRTPYIGPVKI